MRNPTIVTSQKQAESARGNSPYTIRNLDAAIAHLERVMADKNALVIFDAAYWRSRIRQAEVTPGVMHTQRLRLRALHAKLDSTPVPAASNY
jgi:hypothetical protein